VIASIYGAVTNGPVHYQANVEVSALAGESERIRKVASYVFGRFAELQKESGARVVLVMDTPRSVIYEGRDPRESESYAMNRIVAEESHRVGLQFVDLTSVFEADFRANGVRFEFPSDGHWNARAQDLAAREVEREIVSAAPISASSDPAKPGT
jgi:hypothetical protein